MHHEAHGHPSRAGSEHSASTNSTELVDSRQRAGHEGEQRSLLLSSLITLKQIVSAALSARAFGHSHTGASTSAQSGLESLLLSTVQHSVASLLQSHRPDLLPAIHGPTPRLALLDVALGQLLMQLSGGEDADHMVSTATHGPASRSFMDAAASHPPPHGGGAGPAPELPQPTFASPAPVDMLFQRREQPHAQHQRPPQVLPAHSTVPSSAYTTASSTHASDASGDRSESASVSTGHAAQHAPTPPAGTAGAQHEAQGRDAADVAERQAHLHQAWERLQSEADSSPGAHPPQAAMEHQYLAPYATAADEYDLSSLPDDEAMRAGLAGLDAALLEAGVGPDLG